MVKDKTELFAKLPLGAVSLEGEINQGKQLSLSYVAVGARFHGDLDQGRASLFRGSPAGLEADPSWIVDGEVPEGGFGVARSHLLDASPPAVDFRVTQVADVPRSRVLHQTAAEKHLVAFQPNDDVVVAVTRTWIEELDSLATHYELHAVSEELFRRLAPVLAREIRCYGQAVGGNPSSVDPSS